MKKNYFSYLKILLPKWKYLPRHSDLDGPILSKKLLLRQNGLQLNRKCLKFIVRYSPNPFLSAFFLHFLPIEWTKPKNHQTTNLVPKSEKLLLIIQKASINNYRCHVIKYSCPKKLVSKSFLDTILQSRWLYEIKPPLRANV